jgi:DivIVA domain-containing protein
MAISLSRPDPSSPNSVSTATFSSSRRGFDPAEVRDFLRMVAAELARLQEREKALDRELRAALRATTNPAVALDEEVVTRLLGEEAVRILSTAREAASQIKVRAEEGASRVLREATDEAQRMREEAEIEAARRRQDAASDAEAELQMAKQQGRDMVNEARAYRERVLGELARRREMARQQIEQLVHGRDRLLQAFERARLAAVDVMAEMTPLGQPAEYVNLSPTTGPVPLMVPATDLPVFPSATSPEVGAESSAAGLPEAPAVDELVADLDDEPAALVEVEVVEVEVEVEVVEVEVVEVEVLIEPGAEGSTDESDAAEATVDRDESTDHEHLAPVVALFAGEIDAPAEQPASADGGSKPSVDDLFAKLRAARTDSVAARATQPHDDDAPEAVVEPDDERPVAPTPLRSVDATEELSVFQPSPTAPEVEVEVADTPFGRRDAELTPLIVAAARKLKRVLADEQNDVLHAMRGQKKVTFESLFPSLPEHVKRYADAITSELRASALAGAASIDSRSESTHLKAVTKAAAVRPAVEALGSTVVQPLRDRVERAVADTTGDPDDLVSAIRAIYREWKTQRIDEHLDDVALAAFGHGQLAAVKPGMPVCWSVDPHGPACPDAEDNALAGVVAAGEEFPTSHRCAPAHEGCRCMLQPAPR